MWSVRILYDVPGWAFYHNARDLQKYAPPDFRVTLGEFLKNSDLPNALGTEPPDFVISSQFPRVEQVRQALDGLGWNSKLVVFWNNGWPQRIQYLAPVLKSADLINFFNESYWRHVGKPQGSVCIPLGVDLEVFRNIVPIEKRPRRLLWMGSQINTLVKGFAAIAVPLRDRLIREGFECDFRLVDSFAEKKLSRQEMVDWYNTGQAFLCTSFAEGTPNVALEAAACGCALITTPVGNMPELIRHEENGFLVEPNVDAFYQTIVANEARWTATAHLLEGDIRAWNRQRGVAELFSTFRAMATSSANAPTHHRPPELTSRVNGTSHPLATIAASTGDKIDLSSKVTAFVTTVGAPSFETCTRFLTQQDCFFRLQIIDNVAPMNAAFQKMLDDCETEFYVQVDEDMLLYPHAIRTLFERMILHPAHIALHVEYLYDSHVRMCIQGVKIFRHEVVKRYPFQDVDGCEVDQIKRFKQDGFDYVVVRPPDESEPFRDTLGLHGTNYTRETAYVRYFVLQRRERRGGVRMLHNHLTVTLADRYRSEPTDINFFALAGAVAGLTAPLSASNNEKDFRTYAETMGFREAAQLYDAINTRKSG